jgi:hypothetical protein
MHGPYEHQPISARGLLAWLVDRRLGLKFVSRCFNHDASWAVTMGRILIHSAQANGCSWQQSYLALSDQSRPVHEPLMP